MNSRRHDPHRPFLAAAMVMAAVLVGASEPDLSSWTDAPSQVPLGAVARFTVNYANAGPGDAHYGYVNVGISAGLPAPPGQITAEQIDALLQSTIGTDTNGNTVMLYLDQQSCEGVRLQLQGPDPPGPMVGLEAGRSGSFTFDLPIPLDPPTFGAMVVMDPAELARVYLPALTLHQMHFDQDMGRYGPGLNCSSFPFAGCTSLDDCFGPRLWMMEPFTAELELADDGGVFGDPTLGCDSLADFTAGRIALIRRGVCTPFTKARHAQEAGAAGVIVVNDGQCADLGPDCADCVTPMDGGPLAGLIDIPVIMLSNRDGKALIDELMTGRNVTVAMGAMTGLPFEVGSFIFSSDSGEVDYNPGNNGHASRVHTGTFIDDFETGDCSRWSCTGR